jgi:hypothetical protein
MVVQHHELRLVMALSVVAQVYHTYNLVLEQPKDQQLVLQHLGNCQVGDTLMQQMRNHLLMQFIK